MQTPAHESDISWQVLRRIVHDWAGSSAELAEVRPLVGGAINTTLALGTRDGRQAVVKVSPHRANRAYAHEAHQLDLLRSKGLPTPRVYAWHMGSLESPFSYILMEFVDGVDMAQAKKNCSAEEFDELQSHLARLVRTLHECRGETYRRALPEDSPAYTHWPTFFREMYDPIWREVEKSNVLPNKTRKQIARVHERLDRLLAHDDCPRLVHWDLWATNILARADEDGRWTISAILDPNCKFAHAEAEIAYMELFHTITPAFLKAYQSSRRLPNEYHQVRKTIYQMYPLIDHVALFGADYVKPLTAVVERTSAFA